MSLNDDILPIVLGAGALYIAYSVLTEGSAAEIQDPPAPSVPTTDPANSEIDPTRHNDTVVSNSTDNVPNGDNSSNAASNTTSSNTTTPAAGTAASWLKPYAGKKPSCTFLPVSGCKQAALAASRCTDPSQCGSGRCYQGTCLESAAVVEKSESTVTGDPTCFDSPWNCVTKSTNNASWCSSPSDCQSGNCFGPGFVGHGSYCAPQGFNWTKYKAYSGYDGGNGTTHGNWTGANFKKG
jgi:hypothetical protein